MPKKRTSKRTVSKKRVSKQHHSATAHRKKRKSTSNSSFNYNTAIKDTFGLIVVSKVIDKI